VSFTPVANLPPVSLIPVATWLANISSNFRKKFETVLLEYSEAGGKLIHEKTESKKSCDTVPLNSSNLNAIISTLLIINLH
jgi:hypothetical protein